MTLGKAVLLTLLTESPTPQPRTAASWWTHLCARTRAAHLDTDIDNCVPVRPGTALAVHAARITSPDQRDQVARSLLALLDGAFGHRAAHPLRVPVHRDAVVADAALIESLALHIQAPSSVRARGMARTRLLLADGCGPLYRPGGGSLTAALRGALAAL